MVIRPQFVALDSSQLGRIAQDKFSNDASRQEKAAAIVRALDESGSILVLCWHHLQELFSHDNTEVVAQRVHFIKSLPMVAFPRSLRHETVIGSVIDIQGHEIAAAFNDPDADLVEVQLQANKAMFHLGPGSGLIGPFMETWPELKAAFAQQAERTREIVAISRSNFAGMSDVKIVNLLKCKVRSPEDIRRRFAELHRQLASDIRQRGDKRIPDADRTSSDFLNSVRQLGEEAAGKPHPVIQILLTFGIDPSEIGPETTVGDVGAMASFKKKLAILNASLGLPWPELTARVAESRLPCGVIQSAVAAHRPDSAEWKGSDLPDTYLACLSAYADVTYVDKRTYEALRQARPKLPKLAAIVRRVEKAADYGTVARNLTDRSNSAASEP